MAMTLEKLKELIAQNRAKAATLTSLAAVLVVLLVRAMMPNGPRSAGASVGPMALAASAAVADSADAHVHAEMEEKLKQSKALWSVLRETRGIAAENAFVFDPSYYVRDASRQPEVDKTTPVAPATIEKSVPKSSDDQSYGLQNRVAEQARQLHIQSTVMAETPLVVINGSIVRVGESILNFKVVAIKPRQVIVKKDGVTLTLEMGKETPQRGM